MTQLLVYVWYYNDTMRSINKINTYTRAHYFESIHALKAGIAFMIAYIVYLSVPHKGMMLQWLFITIVVVMASNSALGMQVHKSIGRIWATLLGAALAIAISFTPHLPIVLPIFLFIAVVVFIYIAVAYDKYTYMASMGLITFTLITISTKPTLHYAIDRTAEILLGIIIALLVSRFIIPIRSIKLVTQRDMINLGRLVDLYKFVLIDRRDRFNDDTVIKLESKVISSINIQSQLSSNLKYENRPEKQKKHNIHLVIRYQRAIYGYFSVLAITRRILTESLTSDDEIFLLFNNFVEQLVELLTNFIDNYPTVSTEKIDALKSANKAILSYTESATSNADSISAIHTVNFIAERIMLSCEQLAKQLQVIST